MVEIKTIDGKDVSRGAAEAIRTIKDIAEAVNACLDKYFPGEHLDCNEFVLAVQKYFDDSDIDISCKFEFDKYDLSKIKTYGGRTWHDGVIPFKLNYRRSRGVTITYYNLFGHSDDGVSEQISRIMDNDKSFMMQGDNAVEELRSHLIKFNDGDVTYSDIKENFDENVVGAMQGLFFRLKWAMKFHDEIEKVAQTCIDARTKIDELKEEIETAKKAHNDYKSSVTKKISKKVKLLMEKCKDA